MEGRKKERKKRKDEDEGKERKIIARRRAGETERPLTGARLLIAVALYVASSLHNEDGQHCRVHRVPEYVGKSLGYE